MQFRNVGWLPSSRLQVLLSRRRTFEECLAQREFEMLRSLIGLS